MGTATQLAFTTQPNGGANGVAWTSQPVVTVEDSGGNTVTTATNTVTLAIATQPGSGATLACTTNPVNAATGVATFAGCQIVGKAGSYTVTASTAGLTSATTSAFTITVGAATQLAFTTQPGGGANGAVWTTQPVVTVEDSGGNTVTTAEQHGHLGHRHPAGHRGRPGLHHQPGQRGNGVATFAGCKITGTAGSYTLSATTTGLTSATTTPSPSPSGRPPSWWSPPSPTAGPTVRPEPPSRW